MKTHIDEEQIFKKIFTTFHFDEKRWAKAPVEVEQIMSLLALQPGKSAVLDFCCGPGRHALEFARGGFQVTGLDNIPEYIAEAQERVAGEDLNAEFIEADVRSFCRPESFDRVLMLASAFGYFKDPEENRQILLNVYRSLKKHGVLLLKLIGKEITYRTYFTHGQRDWVEQDEWLLLTEKKIIEDWSGLEIHTILQKDQHRITRVLYNHLYSAGQLSQAVDLIRLTYRGTPYDHLAKRLVLVARKS